MARSVVRLPSDVRSPFDVYVNGVRQQLGADYRVHEGALVFERELRKDRISGWRWFLGAWGVGTYRQDDSVDVRYQRPDGSPALAEKLDIELRSTGVARRTGAPKAVWSRSHGRQRRSVLRIARVAGERLSV